MKIVWWILLSLLPALLGCLDYMHYKEATPKGMLMFMVAYMILFFLWLFKGYYFKEECIEIKKELK